MVSCLWISVIYLEMGKSGHVVGLRLDFILGAPILSYIMGGPFYSPQGFTCFHVPSFGATVMQVGS